MTKPLSEKYGKLFAEEVKRLGEMFNLSFFFVTEGVSVTSNKDCDAVRNARLAHIEWEKANGIDPNHSWELKKKKKDKFWVLHDSKGNIVKGSTRLFIFNPKMKQAEPRWHIGKQWMPVYRNPQKETFQRLVNLANRGYIWKEIELPCTQYNNGQTFPINRKGMFWENVK